MKNLYIIGARGFGREVFELFKDCHLKDISCVGFLDDKYDALMGFSGYPPIISSVEDFIPSTDDVFICALGDVKYKKKYIDIILEKKGKFINLIHPTVYISPNAKIGGGCIIFPYTRISCDTKIGNYNTFQPFCVIGHDTEVGNYCHFNTYSFLGGFVKIRDEVTLHTGAIIHPYKYVDNGSIIGAGAVVIKNIKPFTTVYGNPAKILDF